MIKELMKPEQAEVLKTSAETSFMCGFKISEFDRDDLLIAIGVLMTIGERDRSQHDSDFNVLLGETK